MTRTLVEKYVEDPERMRLYQQERAIYEITELIESVMEAEGVSRATLAKRLGKSKGWITQLLDGETNKTIRTVADVLAVLGQEFRVFAQPIRISNEQGAAARNGVRRSRGAS
jgi:transcriptional regulator with XRE-family HTH domain